MVQIARKDAESHLSELLAKAIEGEDVIIVDEHGEALAQISSAKKSKKKRTFGLHKGQIWISPDFDEPLEDFKEYME